MKRKLILLSLVLLSLVLNSCTISPIQKDFSQVEAKLKVMPDDVENITSDKYCLVETIDGKEEKVLASFHLNNPQYTSPINKITKDTYVLAYISDDAFYKIGSKKIVDAKGKEQYIEETINKDDNIVTYLQVTYNPTYNNYLMVLSNERQLFTSPIGIYFWGSSAEKYVEVNIDDNSKRNLLKTNTKDRRILKEQYTHIFASGNDNYLYYDYINDDLIPKIYRIKVGETQKNPTVYKTKASIPVASLDNSIFAYNYSENASYSANTMWKTIIEKDEKIVKQYETKRIILMDMQDKEIYAIDPVENTLEVLGMTSCNVKFMAKVDKGFIFPQIANGKLQYTCPVYENGQIKDYVVKEESN